MLKRPARRRGAGLMELLVAASIVLLISAGVLGLAVTTTRHWSRDTAKTIADDDVSLALQNAVRRISDGKSATVTNGVLYVTMPRINTEGDYDRFQSGATYSFRVETNNLYRVSSTGAKELMGRNIASATFAASGATVGITLVSNKQWGTDKMQSSVSTFTSLRNFVE